MTDRKTLVHSHVHWRNVKRQVWQRELVARVLELLRHNDHDSLALIARTVGVPPQLRKSVWPVLLKYHPMVISPNVVSNTLVWGGQPRRWHRHPETRARDEIEGHILHDLGKYFHRRTPAANAGPQSRPSSHGGSHGGSHSGSHSGSQSGSQSGPHSGSNSGADSPVMMPDELRAIELLKNCILNFLDKWASLLKYESGLAWIALALAEWVPLEPGSNHVLPGKRHGPLVDLYREYPLPRDVVDELDAATAAAPASVSSFDALFERLVLVIFHSPDISMAENLTEHESPDHSLHQYYPVISGGDLSFQCQLFFKVFSVILPELYQPVSDEEILRPSKSTNWMYWWLKCAGARVFHKQDRARLWDTLLGWRPHPQTINFYLNYNNRLFDHLYSTRTSSCIDPAFLKKICKYEHDAFWFPDLDSLHLGSPGLKCDFQIFSVLLANNRSNPADLLNLPKTRQSKSGKGVGIPFSLIDPHIQLVFIYIAILQQHEFKLLEFEEAEVSEFLNNVPLLSRADDYNYKRLYDIDPDTPSVSSSETDIDESLRRPSSHMRIEVGDDDKTSNSFDDLYNLAGDIWRKWIWRELEDNAND